MMEIITSIEEMKTWSRRIRDEGKVIGLTPTMGCLHEGHLSLIKASITECDSTVVSIFVNPAQFGPDEDLESYPRTLEADKEILRSTGVDVLFLPAKEDLYPDGFKSFVEIEGKTNYLCGKSRPGFFRGVATIVLKLFNIVNPRTAFFGEKDWQQLEVIRTLVRDLNLDIKIAGQPIVRESDGLAMSSRNRYLSEEGRLSALSLSQALKTAQSRIEQGERSTEIIRNEIRQMIEQKNGTEVDYISVCDPEDFSESEQIRSRTLIALAVRIGKARLIDNRIIERA